MIRITLLSTLFATAFTAGVYAEDVLKKVDAYLRPDFNIVLDGKPVKLEGAPLIYDGSSYLPLKELGNLLGANILWKGETKTIYINSRINPEQAPPDPDAASEEIRMTNPYSAMYTYLGADYPVLITYGGDQNRNIYWRLSDVRKMGIDTSGLPLAKERYTQQLYVSEQELKKKWRQTPRRASSQRENYIIAGEVNAKKIEAIRNYIKNSTSLKTNDITFYMTPIIVEAMPEENYYEYLFWQNAYLPNGKTTGNRLFKALIKLSKDINEDYYTVNTYNQTDLKDEAYRRDGKE
jgi:hypothetical protein